MSLPESVAFDAPNGAANGFGGVQVSYTDPPEGHTCRAKFIYFKGAETVEAERLTGRGTYKVKVRSCAAARRITQGWRMRDLRRGEDYNIREVDAVADRRWVYLVVERGVGV